MTKSLEVDSHTHGQLIFDKGGKKTHSGEETVPSATGIKEAGILRQITHKISLKCLTDLKHKDMTPQDS